MKAKSESPDELSMKSGDFDRIMRGALVVAPPAEAPKAQANKPRAAAPKKQPTKR